MEDWERTTVEEQEDMSDEKRKQTILNRILGIGLGILILILLIVFGYQKVMLREERIAYKTEGYEKNEEIRVTHIQKEKGKEPIYTISSYYLDGVKIPESTYVKYIGEGNNTITLKIEELKVYLASEKSGSGYSFDESDVRVVMKVSCPWEDSPKPFSKEEVDEVVTTIIDTFNAISFSREKYDWMAQKFSFEYTRKFSYTSTENCLEKGAIKWVKDTQ